MKDANYFIEKLDMIAHPEGGYYKESFISAENITDSDSTTTLRIKEYCGLVYIFIKKWRSI